MENDLGVVLRAVDYKDYDKILTVFCRKNGRVSIRAKAAKSLKSQNYACSQPLCCGIYSYNVKDEKGYLASCEIKKEYFSLAKNYEAYTVACAMIEITEKILMESYEYRRLFVLFINCLEALEKGLPPREVYTFFLVWITDILGIRPAEDFCTVCGKEIKNPQFFSVKEGGAVCEECAKKVSAKKISPETFFMMRKIFEIHPKNFAGLPGGFEKLEKIMGEYVSVFGEINIKTAEFIK